MPRISFRNLRALKDPVSAKEYNRLVDLVGSLASSLVQHGFINSSGIFTRPTTGTGDTSSIIRVFDIQSTGTGDGIYNCYRQKLDATEWADTVGDDKFDDYNSTSVEVLNLLEHHPNAGYARGLAVGDRLACWKWIDDEGNDRWVGIPIGPYHGVVYRARAQEAAPADTNLSVKLTDQDGAVIGNAFDVACEVSGGGNLNAAVPRIANSDYVFVINIAGTWYCTTVFQTTEDCTCG